MVSELISETWSGSKVSGSPEIAKRSSLGTAPGAALGPAASAMEAARTASCGKRFIAWTPERAEKIRDRSSPERAMQGERAPTDSRARYRGAAGPAEGYPRTAEGQKPPAREDPGWPRTVCKREREPETGRRRSGAN